MSSADKVILSCALTGAVTTKKHCPAIPYTPVEIAEEARRAYEAGAAIVHIHARNDDGSPTWSKDTFARIMEETKKRCPVLINWSTGGAGLVGAAGFLGDLDRRVRDRRAVLLGRHRAGEGAGHDDFVGVGHGPDSCENVGAGQAPKAYGATSRRSSMIRPRGWPCTNARS